MADKKIANTRIAVLIRHSKDEPPEDSTFRYDPKLTPYGKVLVEKQIKNLVKRYGLPDRIYTSGIYRAQQTASLFRKYLKRYHGHEIPECEVRSELNRFFAPDERGGDVRMEDLDTTETREQFIDRVKTRTASLVRRKAKRHMRVWYVTHFLVIRELSDSFRFTYPHGHMPALWHVKLSLGM